MNHCKLCHEPIRKQYGHESDPDELSCWTHVEGGYMCKGSYSEYDLATFDLNEKHIELVAGPAPEDYCI
jgi:hypothetical protein